ncbi:hypothetical protein [Lactococcus petauri]|uniref:Uncharacterized protein n=1 Tax=Lactococcus petauri TaxID=1940789 RepID=A0A252CF40_9LACT|nr:hypothetical protein [Lactococcus petauri]OUK05155.1 hypothetical protein BZZ03_00085 [Lactococcus petauri]
MRSNPRNLQPTQEEVPQSSRKKSRKILWASIALFTVVLVGSAIVMFNQQEEHFKQIREKNVDLYATQKTTQTSSSSQKKDEKPQKKTDKKSEKKKTSSSTEKVTHSTPLSKAPVEESEVTSPLKTTEAAVEPIEEPIDETPQVSTVDKATEANEGSEGETSVNSSEVEPTVPQKVIIRPARDIDLKVYIGQDVESVTDELVKEGAVVIWNFVNAPSTPSHQIMSVEGHDNVATFTVAS